MKSDMYDNMYRTDSFHWWFRAKREIVLGLIDTFYEASPGKKTKVIDFGCGCGLMLNALSKYGEVFGADFSEQALEYCRTRFSGSLQQLDLSLPASHNENFDVGIALDILEHIAADKTAAENILGFLSPGGKCVITVPANQWMWSAHDENCMHIRRYNKSSLQELLSNAGFKIEYISYYNCLLFLPAAAVRVFSQLLHLDHNSAIENEFKDNIFNKVLYRIFSLEKKWICSYRHFPFGVSLIALVSKPIHEEDKLLG